MKRSLLLLLVILISLSGYSQNSKLIKDSKGIPTSIKSKALKVSYALTTIEHNIPYRSSKQIDLPSLDTKMHKVESFTEATIGNTRYDFQSNRSTAKRISNNGDGTLSAVWNFTPDGGSNGTDRGTGYNYFDGTSWDSFPTSRIEPVRTGSTNIDFTPQAGEFVIAHTSAAAMLQTSRATKGTGPWDTTTVGNPTILAPDPQADVWSRFALGGPSGNSVHVIVNSQGTGSTPVLGQNGPLTYSRSLDGGLTWIDDHIQIPGTDSTFMYGVGAEEYHIDARGNVVAIVTGGFTNDVVLFKSLDDGATWTRTVILPFPLGQSYDPTTMNTDTTGDGIGEKIESNSGDVTVTIDNNNICHVAFGQMFTSEDSGAVNESFYPTDNNGLYYWHEGMSAPVIIASAEDFNGNGMIDIPTNTADTTDPGLGVYNVGLIGQPSIGIDASNNVYIAYCALDERADTTVWQEAHKHIFLIASFNGGATWSNSYSLNRNPDGYYIEAVWPSVATLVDNCVHLVYQRDSVPGHSITGSPWNPNLLAPSDIVYVCVPTSDLVGINEHNVITNEWVSVNYPNPVKDFTTINTTLAKTSNITVEITNVLGQSKYILNKTGLAAGNHNIPLDVSLLDAGIYFYTVSDGERSVSRKMVVE